MTKLATRYSGSLALRLVGAEELIARSASFQRKVGAGNIDDAKKRIYGGEVTLIEVLEAIDGGTLEAARPCVVIGVQAHMYSQIGQGSAITLGASGATWVLFLDNPEQKDDSKLSLFAFADWVSQVTDDISNLVAQDVGADDYTLWPYNTVRMFLEPLRPDIADRQADDYWLCGYVFSDSINGGS